MGHDTTLEKIGTCMKTISIEMKAARKSRRLSKKDVAEKLGISIPTYTACENGVNTVSMVNFLKCITFYGMSDTFCSALARLAREGEKTALNGQNL